MGRLIPAVANLLERKPRVIRLEEKVGDSEAAYDLAVTTHRFSKRARDMVDDKLSTSAALMRAGEVAEAQRLLAEAEQDLRAEEQELIRQVEELETYRSLHKPRVVVIERPTRASLSRMLAVAMAACTVLAVATMGGAVMGLFEPDSPIRRVSLPTIDRIDGQAARAIQSAAARRGVSVLINGIEVVLSRSEWRALKKAQRDGDPEALSNLLDEIAPELTVSASGEILEIVTEVGVTLEGAVRDAKQEAEENTASGSGGDGGSSAETSEDQEGSETGDETEPAPEDDSTGDTTEEDTGTSEDGGDGTVQSELGTSIGTGVGGAGGTTDSFAG